MKVLMGICLEDYVVEAQNGDTLELKRGQEYTVSAEERDGCRIVFSSYWCKVPSKLFGGLMPL